MGAILAQITSVKSSNIPVAISLITGIPSCALYMLVVWTMCRNWKKFDSSYWRLFFIRALIHIYDFLNSTLFFRIGLLPLGYSLLASFWRHLLPFSIAFTFIVPLFDTWENLIREYKVEYADENLRFDNTTFVINYNSDTYNNDYGVLNVLNTSDNQVGIRSSVILLVVCTLLNVTTLFFYARQPNNGGGGTSIAPTMSAEERSVERRLLIFSVLNFLCQLLMALWWIITVWCYDNYYFCVLLKNSQYLIKDIDALHSPPWLILWSSTQLREMVAMGVGLEKWFKSKNGVAILSPSIAFTTAVNTENRIQATRTAAWTTK